MNRILFAGGGTAGHIEPAWAVSQVWRNLHPGDQIAFLGTKSGLEVELIPNRGGTLYLIPKVTAPRKLALSLLLFPFKMLNSIYQTLKIVKQFDAVVGFGGYVSASAYLAAFLLRKPVVIHDQNAKVGIANRLGARFAKEILVAYPNAAKSLNGGKVKAQLVGNPLKVEIIAAAQTAAQDWQSARTLAKNKLAVAGPLVLVLGGSSGSTSINEVIANTKFKDQCTVIHSVGKNNELPRESANYRPIAYIDDMATALLASDLVISRSGAIATSEFAALGKYALFIPLPIGNGEQALNAEALVAAKKAECLAQRDFTSEWLTANLSRLLAQGSVEAFGANLNSANLIANAIERTLK